MSELAEKVKRLAEKSSRFYVGGEGVVVVRNSHLKRLIRDSKAIAALPSGGIAEGVK